ncbi:MAG: hypothetical protein HC890_11865 [Chloroflexaceae bacterium]|nr:hypothetical protein [Chloroflexaceae bacterium]
MGQRIFASSEGMVTGIQDLPLGYALTYNNLVRAGMSGGPIVNQQGQLIGINGLVRLEGNSSQIVASGIPISRYLQWRRVNLPKAPQGVSLVSPSPATASPYAIAKSWQVGRGSLNALDVQGSQSFAASGNSKGTIALWNLADGTAVKDWQAHSQGVSTLKFSPNGEILASGGEDNTIKLWQVATGTLLATLSGHQGAIRSPGL